MKIFNDPETIRDEKDWIEAPEFDYILQNEDSNLNTSDLNRETNYTVELIEQWYLNRTTEIENLSGLVDVSLNFSILASGNGCKNMSNI